MNSTDPPLAVERGIATLVSDSIDLAMEAELHADHDFQHTLARASILSSALFVEACANACIDLLGLGSKFADEVDRLPTIGKLDLFLHVRLRGVAINRSRAEYQGFCELKNLRDSFVHPRAQRYEWLEWTESSSVSTAPKTKSLGMSKIPSFCFSGDAIIALRAAHRFTGYFFRECARMRPKQVSALFHSESVVPDLTDTVTPSWPMSTKKWLDSRSIDVSYFRVHWSR